MILGLFRHGIAVPHDTPGVEEDERPLTREGIKRTRRAAQGIRRLKPRFDVVLSSPLVRARETADILCDVLQLPAPHIDDRLVPGASPRTMLEPLMDITGEAPLFVGHEPSLSSTVAYLLSSSDSDAFALKKAGLAVVRLARVAPRPTGELMMLLRPSTLRDLAK